MSDELHFEPQPGVEYLASMNPPIIVDVVVRLYPPGTPAPPRAVPPWLRKRRITPPAQESPPAANES